MSHGIMLRTPAGLKDLGTIKTIREVYKAPQTITSGIIAIPLGLLEGGIIAVKSNTANPAPSVTVANPTQLLASSTVNATMGLTTSNNWELLVYRSS